jgi:chaperonin GroEL
MPENIPKVILNPHAGTALRKGFNQMTRVLESSMGPTRGTVFHSTALKSTPEPITDAATIARRITELPGRSQNVGAMLLRSLVWRVHLRVGDGCATTAVLAQSMLEHGSRYVSAGASPVRVQAGIQKATRLVIARLSEMAAPVKSAEQLVSVVYTATREPELSFMLGEMFDLLGEHAHVVVEKYMAPYLEREYIDGGQWQAKIISPLLVSEAGSGKAVARECNVVLFNGTLSHAEEVLPIIKILSTKEQKNLLLVAQKISGEAANILVATHVKNKSKLGFVLVELTRVGGKAVNDLQDLSILTGARVFDPEAGDRLAAIKPEDMGSARRAEANSETLVLTGGKGNPTLCGELIEGLQKHLERLAFDDKERQEVEMRLGRLSGSSGILKVGAYTQNERDVLHQKAEKGIKALKAAQQAGVLPGGGTAFLHCISLVEKMDCADEDERMGYRAVAQALWRPFEQLLKNSGVTNSRSLAHEITSAAPGLLFDLHRKQIRVAEEAGVLDPAQVLIVGLETASSGAQMALSTDVLVLKRNPRISNEP